MKVERGDIVLVSFPFSSAAASKLRPAVVVQADGNNLRLNSTILAAITSNTARSLEPTQVFVDPATPDGALAGVLRPSIIKCENLATIETALIQRKIGQLSAVLFAELDAALKASLDLH
jgi:mRNA interferase MazF